MTQDVLLRRGEAATLGATAMTAVTLLVSGLGVTGSVEAPAVGVPSMPDGVVGTSALVAEVTPAITYAPDGLSNTSAVGTPVVNGPVALQRIVVVGLGTTGGLGSVVPRAGISGLIDDFDNGTLGPAWTVVGGSALEAEGFVALIPPQGAEGTARLRTVQGWDLVGQAVVIKVLAIGANDTYRYLTLRDAAGNGLAIQLWAALGQLRCGVVRLTSAGPLPAAYYAGAELFSGSLQPLTSGDAAWWVRVVESTGIVACAVAPSTSDNPPAANQWVTKWSGSLAGVNLANLTYELHGSNEGSAAVAYFDAVNAESGFVDPAAVFDVVLRTGATTTLIAPAFGQGENLPMVTGLAGTGGLGAPNLVTADIVLRVTGGRATALLETLVAMNQTVAPDGLAGTSAVAPVQRGPQPLGPSARADLGAASVVLPDLAVRPTGQTATATVSTVTLVRREPSRLRSLLLRRLSLGGD